MTRVHPVIPIIVPGVGSLENRTPSTFHPKETHKAKPRRASKAKRNFRINGESRGASPALATATKYMRSGGPERRAAKIARHLAKLERRRAQGAQRRLGVIDRRYDRRLLKAAEQLVDALD